MSEVDVQRAGLPPRAAAQVRRARVRRALALLIAASGAAGCGKKAGDTSTIDRAAFVDTYVDLRLAALASPTHSLTPAARDSVLTKHHVTDQDLLHFVDVQGADPSYMVKLWTDVSKRVPLSPPPPSAGIPLDTTHK